MLQKLYKQSAEDAPTHLKRWYFWATHSRLTPIVKAAKTIKAHWEGVSGEGNIVKPDEQTVFSFKAFSFFKENP